MKNNYSEFQFPSFAKQKGMVLIVGLVMILLLTIIGVAAIRGSGLQERMTFNMRDKTVSFLATESGLRACETTAVGFANPPATPCLPGSGLCNNLNGTPNAVNSDSVAWQNLTGAIAGLNVPNVAVQPRCLVEVIQTCTAACAAKRGESIETCRKLGGCVDTRVTVIGTGAEQTTQSVLQSTMSEP